MSIKLDEYKNNRALNARIPNYNVSMGFGLHVGWAIEVIIFNLYFRGQLVQTIKLMLLI